MKLVIATPFYEVKAYSPYITSLLNSVKVLDELGIEWDYYELSGDSYVDRAKNTLVHRFLQSDFTHIFMVDSDESWDVEGFARLIRAALDGAEVVGGAYPCKNNWEFFGCIPKIDEETGFVMGKENGDIRLLDMWGIPGGFIIYSREAFERTRPNLKTYTDPIRNETYLECFNCHIEEGGSRVGEDIYFQIRYKEMGGKVWLEPNINILHWGIKAWAGNYHEYLLNNKGSHEVDLETKMLAAGKLKDCLERYDEKCG